MREIIGPNFRVLVEGRVPIPLYFVECSHCGGGNLVLQAFPREGSTLYHAEGIPIPIPEACCDWCAGPLTRATQQTTDPVFNATAQNLP